MEMGTQKKKWKSLVLKKVLVYIKLWKMLLMAMSKSAGRPNVKNITLLLSKWWGSGVVHVKVWISDEHDVYIGSANNDWKSLTQVKEARIYLADCPTVAKKVEVYYNY